MTVDAGNMVTVSRKLKEQYPDAAHIILGEDDFTKSDNKGLNKAQEAAKAIDGTYIIPQFTDGERAQAFSGTASFSDFNDIHASRGLDAVRDQLAPVLDPLLPHWRQTFSEENTMPDTNHLQDTPADRQPNAVAMTDNNVTQTVTDAAPILPQEPIPIPAEEKPVSEVIASPSRNRKSRCNNYQRATPYRQKSSRHWLNPHRQQARKCQNSKHHYHSNQRTAPHRLRSFHHYRTPFSSQRSPPCTF